MNFYEEHAIETYRSLITISVQAFKGLQLLNGGAVVALLAYFGQEPEASDVLLRGKYPMTLFVAGLVASTFAFFTSYLTQLALHNENIEKLALANKNIDPRNFDNIKHVKWLVGTGLFGVASVGLFAWGAFECINILTGSAATIK